MIKIKLLLYYHAILPKKSGPLLSMSSYSPLCSGLPEKSGKGRVTPKLQIKRSMFNVKLLKGFRDLSGNL